MQKKVKFFNYELLIISRYRKRGAIILLGLRLAAAAAVVEVSDTKGLIRQGILTADRSHSGTRLNGSIFYHLLAIGRVLFVIIALLNVSFKANTVSESRQ